MGELIAVLSGKGGTGKTSVCAGIATALAEGGRSVLCIDCDIGLRNLDISLGLSEVGALSFLDEGAVLQPISELLDATVQVRPFLQGLCQFHGGILLVIFYGYHYSHGGLVWQEMK